MSCHIVMSELAFIIFSLHITQHSSCSFNSHQLAEIKLGIVEFCDRPTIEMSTLTWQTL